MSEAAFEDSPDIDAGKARPMFRADLQVEVIAEGADSDHVVLLGEERHHILRGKAFTALAPLLDGSRTVGELAEELYGTVSPPEVYYAVAEARRAGVVVDARPTDGLPDAERAFWQARGHLRPEPATVGITALGDVDAGPLVAALHSMGIRGVPQHQADLVVVVVDHYLHPALESINRRCLVDGRRWLPVKLIGVKAWFGPLFDGAGCWECLASRLREQRPAEALLERRGAETPIHPHPASTPASLRAAAALAAIEIAGLLRSTAPSPLEGHVLTFDFAGPSAARHRLVARPQCHACGSNRAPAGGAAPVLRPAPKRFVADGGHRVCHPEETLARFAHHISPVTGIISAIHDRTDDADGMLHSLVAVHHFAMVRDDVNILRDNLAGRSGGKGVTRAQATVSALGEAVERYSGVWRGAGEEMTVRATQEELGMDAIPLDALLLFSERQVATREEWNARTPGVHHVVPNPLDPALPIDWSPVWSLRGGGRRWVPASYCWYGHPDMRHFLCFADTNGCAAGNTLEEAILQAFFELAERDAVAIWWYNRARRPAVDLHSFDLPWVARLQEMYAAAGRDLQVLDLTSDLEIPTFAAVSRRLDALPEDVILGFGAHLDPPLALLRALTEVNQSFPIVRDRDGDGKTIYRTRSVETLHWLQNANSAAETYLLADTSVRARRRGDWPVAFSDDVRDDIRICVDAAARAGLDTFVLDQTRADVGMPVARVIVPGLRHFWRRLGPGRLYDVPVRLGWLAAPLSEQDLNPYSVFF